MKLNINGDDFEGKVTESILEEKLNLLTGEGDSFLILLKDEMTYLQTAGSSEQGFILEYQESSLDNHYSCTNRTLPSHQVVQAFKDYLNDDPIWKTSFDWEEEDFSIQNPTKYYVLLLLIIIAVIGFWFWI